MLGQPAPKYGQKQQDGSDSPTHAPEMETGRACQAGASRLPSLKTTTKRGCCIEMWVHVTFMYSIIEKRLVKHHWDLLNLHFTIQIFKAEPSKCDYSSSC